MAAPTQPPVDATVRTVWTPRKEAQLNELKARRAAVMTEAKRQLGELLAATLPTADESELETLVMHAAAYTRALKPFILEE